MIDARTLVLSTLTLSAAVVTAVGPEAVLSLWSDSGGRASAAVAGAQDSAWALLAEAEELCRGSRGRGARVRPSEAGGDENAASARRALGAEALEIVRELVARAPAAPFSEPVRQAERRLRRLCARPRALADLGSDSLRSLDGSARFERGPLLVPFLARLNEAAAIEAAPIFEPALPAPEDPAREAARASSEPVVAPGVAGAPLRAARPGAPAGNAAAQAPRIRIGGGSRRYRERVRQWSAVFAREAPALRAGRRELQVEIERHSMAEARGGCRSFGLVLARLDEDLVAAAPSRGLSILTERMVARYWRGVAQCVAGRPAAAFAHLSEGDRDWGTIAQTAARMVDPRPMKPLRPARRPLPSAAAAE